jgi:leucyl aminopeptidase
MEFEVVRADIVGHSTPLLAVGLLEGDTDEGAGIGPLDERLGGRISRLIASGDFKGKEGQSLVVYPDPGQIAPERVLLVGMGKREASDLERVRRAAGTAAKQAAQLGLERFSISMPEPSLASSLGWRETARAVAEGIELGSYLFDEMKSKADDGERTRRPTSVDVLSVEEGTREEIEEGVRIGAILARAENLARTLGNLPGNIATPTYLAKQASEIAERNGQSFEVLGPTELEREGLGALLAVSRGSAEEPRLIIIEHRRGPAESKPLVLVGKGLTFDSGGISIKPSAGMEDMKFDMCGGAAVIAAMQAIGELDVPTNVIGIVPSAENMPSSRAVKPGDIVRSHLGKTIEVINTDAEGRLILADALSYARRFEPAAMVDVATLTGACVVALGTHVTGGMGNDEDLLNEIRAAGDRVSERVWPLPMFDEYREQLRSEYADIKNSGGRWAGAITGGWFLREFVGDVSWVHLDIAGPASGDGKLAYQSKGATGVPTRLLVDWVLSRAG